ncbi:MAG: DUF4214 domain-containing protein [Acidobacteriota bacterium]|nr:DUF4214 domain-containing protein [Acidobacteriota bacterium]
MAYGYNTMDQMTMLTYPSGRMVTNSYDVAGRLTGVADATRSYVSELKYKAHGGLESERWGNTAVHSMTYNARLQAGERRLMTGGTEVQRYTYAYGAVDMATGAVDTTKNTGQIGRIESFVNGTKQWDQRHKYDELGRLDLAAEHLASGALNYRSDFDYDRYGNRYRPSQGTQNQNLYYTPVETTDISQTTNRFTTPAQTPISYDPSGNITADFKFRAQSYSYDANNRLTKTFDLDGKGRTSGVYDASGQRVQVTIEGEWRHFVYDAMGRVVSEYGPGGRERERIYRGSQMLATEESTGACRKTIEQFVEAFYWGALGRQPDASEKSSWVTTLRTAQGQGQAQLMAQARALGDALFNSSEYATRNRTNREYVHDLYWGYLQRGGDDDGYSDWVAAVENNGRAVVRDPGFAQSIEFTTTVGQLCAGTQQPAVLWQMTDHTGSVRVVLDEAGVVKGRHDYLPFGDEIVAGFQQPPGGGAPERSGEPNIMSPGVENSTGLHNWQTTIRPRFAEMEKDAATGLEHTQWRKYDSWAGRWTTPDPYLGSMSVGDPQSFNSYAYVSNDPINLIDPSGLEEYPFGLGPPPPIRGFLYEEVTVIADAGWGWGWGFGGGSVFWDIRPIPYIEPITPVGEVESPIPEPQNPVSETARFDETRLNDCVSRLYGIELGGFTASQRGRNGSFVGVVTLEDGARAGFRVVNDVNSFSRVQIGNISRGRPDNGVTVNGIAFTADGRGVATYSPYRNYTANNLTNPTGILGVQIHELGHSLTMITGIRPETSSRSRLRPGGADAGTALERCVFGGEVGSNGRLYR